MKNDEKELTLEENIKNLEDVISQLSDDSLPLEKSFELYKKGIDLLAKCNASVDKVEKELQVIESEGFVEA